MPAKWAELSVRAEPKGGDVLNEPKPSDLTTAVSRVLDTPGHRMVLLIHGYNVSQAAGEETYRKFREIQESLGSMAGAQTAREPRAFVRVYWPGDRPNWFMSLVDYPGALDHAKQSAMALAKGPRDILHGIPDLKPLEIVAHSMGCRLTLELLSALYGSGIRVGRVVFMAGAVPTFLLDDTSSNLRKTYDLMFEAGALSLYSRSDDVLSLAFPLGQTSAREGVLPTALGHDHWESSHPPALAVQQTRMPEGTGHTDYWCKGWEPWSEPYAVQANKHVRDYLEFAPPGARTTPAHELPTRHTRVFHGGPPEEDYPV